MDISSKPQITKFIEDRISKGSIQAVILYGSFARGNANPTSDVDLMFVVTDGFLSSISEFDDLYFEIIEATEEAYKTHWTSKPDLDRLFCFWKYAKILYDFNGAGNRLQKYAQDLLKKGKTKMSCEKITNNLKAANKRLEKIKYLFHIDPTSANVILEQYFLTYLESWFTVNGIWKPQEKEYIEIISKKDLLLGKLINAFYNSGAKTEDKITVAQNAIQRIFKTN